MKCLCGYLPESSIYGVASEEGFLALRLIHYYTVIQPVLFVGLE